ncbi:metallophosphoesterase [Halovenus sp. HT40]|uniref:metallophosphoesterase n=1 Tax=Halovenus sp. HT40 TaxID=3126691 RepID=UPI00300F519F
MKSVNNHSAEIESGEGRDTAEEVRTGERSAPAIVSISDIHGYRDDARSALLTLSDHREYDPLVDEDEDGRLHWADHNYILLFNGDLVDRGPRNEEALALVARLLRQAPPGRVRVTLGNHEAVALSPEYFNYTTWYSGQVDQSDREALIASILAGVIVAAYQGYNVVYAHAGAGGDGLVTRVIGPAVDAGYGSQHTPNYKTEVLG